MTCHATAPTFPALPAPDPWITYEVEGQSFALYCKAAFDVDITGLLPEAGWDRFAELFGRQFPDGLAESIRTAIQAAITEEIRAALQTTCQTALEEAARPRSERAFRRRLRSAPRGPRRVLHMSL